MMLKDFYDGVKNKSDKGTTHDYINSYYDKEFTDKKNKELKILEIGIHAGLSINLWKNYFINSKIIGIDTFTEVDLLEEIKDEILNSKNVEIIKADAYTQQILDRFDSNTFDYIIDDGPHTLESQIFSIKFWSKKIKKEGKLIIEDIQSIDSLNKLILEVDSFDMKWEVFDLRNNKGRYDDIILEITNNI